MKTLAEYFAELGYPPERWHIGPEHPHLEDYAIQLVSQIPRIRVLEIGYQSGGFAIPLILAHKDHAGFSYVGVDNGQYATAVDGSVMAGYLSELHVKCSFEFRTADAGVILKTMPQQVFDLILVDHYKPLYPRDFYTIARRRLLSTNGYVLFHDVLGRAESVWKDCQRICAAFGFSWYIVEEVPGGLAVARLESHADMMTKWRRVLARTIVELRRFATAVRYRVTKLHL